MRIVVRRKWRTGRSTISMIELDGEFFCYGLEPANPIPEGSYDVTIRPSFKFHREMPHVEEVPGHTEIEIHWGNWPKDTEDCLLLGLTYDPKMPDFIGESQIAFDDFFEKLRNSPSANYITYTTGDTAV